MSLSHSINCFGIFHFYFGSTFCELVGKEYFPLGSYKKALSDLLW